MLNHLKNKLQYIIPIFNISIILNLKVQPIRDINIILPLALHWSPTISGLTKLRCGHICLSTQNLVEVIKI